MATHSSILAWKTPWTEDPGRLQSMGLQRVGHDWATSLHFTSYRAERTWSWSFLPCWLQPLKNQENPPSIYMRLSFAFFICCCCFVHAHHTSFLCSWGDQTNPKGNQPWIFSGRTLLKVILWPPDVKSQLIGKNPEIGKDWGQEKGATGEEMVGWHHRLSGHGFGWTPGVGNGQRAWRAAVHGVAKSWTQLSDWTELKQIYLKNTFSWP